MGNLGELATQFGLGPALLILAVYALLVGRWAVPRWVFDDLRRDRDEWKAMALRATRVAERSADIAEPLVKGPAT